MTTATLYAPPDVDAAYHGWGANCGPCALAALLGRSVEEVRRLFAGFERRRYVNPTHMKAALDLAGARWHTLGSNLPSQGLVFLQLQGPWTRPGVPVKAAYRHTHWVAHVAGMVYDANADAWLTKAQWDRHVGPRLLEADPGATGFTIKTGIKVQEVARG